MIRINLLPDAKKVAATGGGAQLWGVIYLLAAFAWGVVLFLVYLNYSNVLEDQNAKNGELETQIDQLKKRIEGVGEIEAQLAKSRQLEEVVTGLQAARQGPARMLMELSRILSEGGGPSIELEKLEDLRRDNPMLIFNPGWDIRRLWLVSFKETGHQCTMAGYGKTNEDVAEFLRRLNISELFQEVTLEKTSASKDPGTGLPVVQFSLTCKVEY
ncbi:MAG: PilN domain-containing protein [Myxococcales bacterium]|nr:PilN domain-containing protein [Myxococcales bacterium]